MSAYDSFATHYDKVVGDREEVAVFLQRLAQRYAPKGKTLLELGCGSGSMLRVLSKRYQARGIDLSPKMIEVARKRAPAAKVSVGDITNFSFTERYDIILCPFDTINHVTSFSAWKRVFANAHRHLKPNGVFIFDVNTETKMERYRTEPAFAEIMEDEISIVDVRRVRRFRYLVNLRLLSRVKGETFRHHEVLIPELVVPTERVLKALSVYFKRVTMIDAERREPSENTEELYFVCQGPR
jgi:SAM-dependent methyltransferase